MVNGQIGTLMTLSADLKMVNGWNLAIEVVLDQDLILVENYAKEKMKPF